MRKGGFHLFLYLALAVYHLVNIYTDIKERKTRWYWHILFFIVGIFYTYGIAATQDLMKPIVIILFIFSIGRLLEVFGVSSAGDTKMLIVTGLWLSLIIPSDSFIRVVLAVFTMHYLLFNTVTFIEQVKKNGVIGTIKSDWIEVKNIFIPGLSRGKEKIIENFPGAVTISIGCWLYIGYMQVIYYLFN